MNAIDVLQQIARIEIERGMAPDEAIERGMSAVGRAQQFIAGQSTPTHSRIDGLPDLPKLPAKPLPISGYANTYSGFQLDEYGRDCYEAGSAAAAQAAKQVPAKTDWDPRTIARFGPAVNPYIVPPAPSATSLAEAAEAQVAPDLNALIGKVSVIENDFIDRYEFDDGESAPHTPTEFESMLITDAIFGLHAEQEWAEAYHAWDVARRAGGYKPWSRVDSEVAPEAAEAGQVEVLLQELETCYRDGNPSGFDVLLSEALYERIRAALAATAASPQAPAQSKIDNQAMHIAHCGSGEYRFACKYGNDDCPMFPDAAPAPQAKAIIPADVSQWLSSLNLPSRISPVTGSPPELHANANGWNAALGRVEMELRDEHFRMCLLGAHRVAALTSPAPQAATGEDLAIYDSIARNYMRDGKPATHAEARVGFPKDGTK